MLVWDNVRLHRTRALRKFIDANTAWLTVVQLPTYASELNATEGIRLLVKRDIGNHAATHMSQVTRADKHRSKTLQYRPDVINGCLTGTDLPLAHSSEAAEEAIPPAGPLDMPGQSARPVVVALQ